MQVSMQAGVQQQDVVTSVNLNLRIFSIMSQQRIDMADQRPDKLSCDVHSLHVAHKHMTLSGTEVLHIWKTAKRNGLHHPAIHVPLAVPATAHATREATTPPQLVDPLDAGLSSTLWTLACHSTAVVCLR